MMNKKDRDLCINVARLIRLDMNKCIDASDHLRGIELGNMLDDFVKFCGKLENKEEVL